MAHIVCKYRIPDCRLLNNVPVYTPEFVSDWCNEDAESYCSDFQNANGHCKHFCWRHFQFEKTVKNYEYSEDFKNGNDGLKLGKQFISLDLIDYLEIDGKDLVEESNEGRISNV